MNKKAVSGIMLTLLLIGMLTFAFNTQTVEASGTIYIRPDGSIDPPTAPILRSGDLYTLTDNIYDSIIVERNSIVLDGDDYTVQGTGIGPGIDLTGRNNVTVKNANVTKFGRGIELHYSSNNTLSANNITNCYAGILLEYSSDNSVTSNTAIFNVYDGICLYSSSNNIVAGNLASNNMYGIALTYFSDSNIVAGNDASVNEYGISLWYDSDSNRVTGNNASNNDNGIYLFDSSFNLIFHNNFIGNIMQAYSDGRMNIWDNGYTSCGNYWSDYIDQDFFIGSGQDQPGSDGVWDHPYVIDDYNQDRYPLVNPWTPSWIPPWIPPGLFADLIRRQAWPEHHHCSISKDEDSYQTLYAKVKNLGNQTVWVKAVFNVTKDDTSSAVIESEPVSIAQGEITDVLANLGPLTEDDVGKYRVSATCQYSHNKIVWAQGEKKKTFKFDVVP